jgi:hypothetical protein
MKGNEGKGEDLLQKKKKSYALSVGPDTQTQIQTEAGRRGSPGLVPTGTSRSLKTLNWKKTCVLF